MMLSSFVGRDKASRATNPYKRNHTLLSDTRLSGNLYPLFDRVRQELRTWRTYYLDPQDAMREAVGPTRG